MQEILASARGFKAGKVDGSKICGNVSFYTQPIFILSSAERNRADIKTFFANVLA